VSTKGYIAHSLLLPDCSNYLELPIKKKRKTLKNPWKNITKNKNSRKVDVIVSTHFLGRGAYSTVAMRPNTRRFAVLPHASGELPSHSSG